MMLRAQNANNRYVTYFLTANGNNVSEQMKEHREVVVFLAEFYLKGKKIALFFDIFEIHMVLVAPPLQSRAANLVSVR